MEKCDHYLMPLWTDPPIRYDQYGTPLYRYSICKCGKRTITYPIKEK